MKYCPREYSSLLPFSWFCEHHIKQTSDFPNDTMTHGTQTNRKKADPWISSKGFCRWSCCTQSVVFPQFHQLGCMFPGDMSSFTENDSRPRKLSAEQTKIIWVQANLCLSDSLESLYQICLPPSLSHSTQIVHNNYLMGSSHVSPCFAQTLYETNGPLK